MASEAERLSGFYETEPSNELAGQWPARLRVIAPDVHDVSLRGFRNLDRIVDARRRAAEEALAEGGREALEEARRRGGPLSMAASSFLRSPATQVSR